MAIDQNTIYQTGTPASLAIDLYRRGYLSYSILVTILNGERDKDKLTDMVFQYRHPEERQLSKIMNLSDSEYRRLRTEWMEIKSKLISPIFKNENELEKETIMMLDVEANEISKPNGSGLPVTLLQMSEFEDAPKGGALAAGNEIDLAEYKEKINTKYGTWTISAMLKSATTLGSVPSGLPVGGQITQTSKLQNGERVMGVKPEVSYKQLKDIFKKLTIEDFTLKLAGEWSGTELSAYGSASFNIVNSLATTPVSLKIYIFKIKEGEDLKLGEIDGYFDSPNFEIKLSGVTTKVYLRFKVSWRLDKEKVGKEILEKLALEKLEKEALKKAGLKILGEKVGETVLKKLGPIITAFGVGWDIGTLLRNYTIAGQVAVDVQEKILGDLNVKYHQADAWGKIVLIAQNSDKIIAAAIASGVAGAVAGMSDLVLFKIFGLDNLKDFGPALEKFFNQANKILSNIPDVIGTLGDMNLATVLLWGMKLNPEYNHTPHPVVKRVVFKIFQQLKPMYKNSTFDKVSGMRLYDFYNVDPIPLVDLIVDRGLLFGNIQNLNISKDEILSELLDLHIHEFILFLERYNLISYKFQLPRYLGTEGLDQRLVNELFV